MTEQHLPNPILDTIYRHGSARRYKSDPVSRQLVLDVIAAGQRASSSSNLQMYSVVVVEDAAKRTRLAELCGNQPHIAQAPVFLAWCADLSRLDRICQELGYSHEAGYVENLLLSTIDAAIAAQNACLAAESLGLGICYIGSLRNNPREVIAMLGLPNLVFPLFGLTLGWPEKSPRIRPRLPLEAVVHDETYDASGEKPYLEAYDEAMIATGIYTNREVATTQAQLPARPYGWREHSARRVSVPQRTFLSDVLREQGFEMK